MSATDDGIVYYVELLSERLASFSLRDNRAVTSCGKHTRCGDAICRNRPAIS